MSLDKSKILFRPIGMHSTIFEGSAEECRHTTLNLINRSKISCGIYRFQQNPKIGGGPKRSNVSNPEIGKHFYEFSTVSLDTKAENSCGEAGQIPKKHYLTFDGKNRAFPKRAAFSRSNSRLSEREKKPRISICTESKSPFLFSQTIETDENANQRVFQNTNSIRLISRKVNEYGQKMGLSCQSRVGFSERFSPWDIQSGFGKSKRF